MNLYLRQYKVLFVTVPVILIYSGQLLAADASRFLKPKAWQCEFSAELHHDSKESTRAAGMAHDPRRQLLQALAKQGTRVEDVDAKTDSYRETMEQTVQGRVHLHYVYDGGTDGIQIAGWNNGEANVHVLNTFEGSEQKQTIFRDKKTTFDGVARLAGDEYEPAFQIWIYPEESVYSIDYSLSPVRGLQVEHCRMSEEQEAKRKKMESATDEDMPLGSFFAGMTTLTCPTERKAEVDIEMGVMRLAVDNNSLPASGLVLHGKGKDVGNGADMSWTCRPE